PPWALPDFAFENASIVSRDIRGMVSSALFSVPGEFGNRTNGPLKPVLLRGSSTRRFMWGFGWLTRLGSPFLKIFWADISKNVEFFSARALKLPGEPGKSALELRLTQP